VYFPASQLVQPKEEELGWNFPAAHGTHDIDLATESLPAAHEVQTAVPVLAANIPAAQSTQAAAAAFEYIPTAQLEHSTTVF